MASGRVAGVRTSALLASTESHEALERASAVARAYQPPGLREGWYADFEEP
jgi:hypothetical protein